MRKGRGALVGAVAVSTLLGSGTAKGQMTEEKLRQEALDERIRALEDKLSSPDLFRVYWKDGLRLTSPDNKFDLKIGGRIHFESMWNDADDDLEATQRYNGNSGDTAVTQSIGPLEDG